MNLWTPERAIEVADALTEKDDILRECPTLGWSVHKHGQDQFLRSAHPARVMVPGNGWGKTVIMGREANHWAHGDHPYVQTPDPSKVLIYWFCEQFKQFDALRELLEAKCLTRHYTWNDQDHSYTFGTGARMVVSSYDRPWTDIQGIPCDLMCFDEEPPLKLWREARRRRRTDRKTRFVIAATATQGESWMEAEIWKPWADKHKETGIGLDQAREKQAHPYFWVWDRGGIYNNPGADAEDIAEYESQTWSSDEEKRVRQHGGFGRFNGRPVFDLAALGVMEARMDEWDKVRGPGRIRGIVAKADGQEPLRVLGLSPDRLKTMRFGLDDLPLENGRLEVWEEPEPGGTYAIGGDCAKGMEGGDFDAAPIYRLPSDKDKIGTKKRQVAMLHGHWGERFDRLLFACARLYNGAFVLLERQEGLAIMRRLWDDYGYTYIYYDRNSSNPARKVSDSLGHARVQDDYTIRNLQIAVLNGDIEIRDRTTLDEMRRLVWFKPGEEPGIKDRPRDADLRMRLPGGGSPDAVMGTAYAWLALREVYHYDVPEDLYPKGSLGDIFGYGKVFAKPLPESMVNANGVASFLRKR